MEPRMAIGDFSRATHLSVKALRHYHDVDLLSPVEVDRHTGYRFYGIDQIKDAQIIRHLRKLEMPVDQVKAVLHASDQAERDEIIVAHLKRMEAQLESTRQTVSLLRAMLDPAVAIEVEHRFVPVMLAAAISGIVRLSEINAWWSDAFEEIYRVLRAEGKNPTGPGGGLYTTELFTDEIGESAIYVPISKRVEDSGRVRTIEIPAAEFAVAVHRGALAGAGPSYAAIGKYVAENVLGAEGPIRERYVEVSGSTTSDTVLTEICWPISEVTPVSP
ncbi:MAG TPA: MerR family transcriptional regulator [Candidatus Cybelea sp.]|jgi:DNA-binding transcriptional MerR regulator|nr:MerR family transcriptional regulator [Candidatus Cybelea sp.]